MFGETTISHVKILNHPIETTIYKWMLQVPGTFIMANYNPHIPGEKKIAKKSIPTNWLISGNQWQI